jgi:hypothetical protein
LYQEKQIIATFNFVDNREFAVSVTLSLQGLFFRNAVGELGISGALAEGDGYVDVVTLGTIAKVTSTD